MRARVLTAGFNLGDRNTTVPWKDDLTVGAIHAILKQLGVDDSF